MHELGHQFHDTDERGIAHDDPFQTLVFREFAALSEWARFTRHELMHVARDDRERRELMQVADRIDVHREKGDTDARVEHGGYYYRYNRYPGSVPAPADGSPRPPTYYRYRKGSIFAGKYPMSDPQDDFAETFSLYLLSPEWLQQQLPVKYEFMHVRVFARERLLRQANRVLERFDARVTEALGFAAPEFAEALKVAHVIPLRVDLDRAMRRQRTRAEREARRTVADKPRPIPSTAVAEQLAKPFLDRLDVLLPVLERAVIATHRVRGPPVTCSEIFGEVDPDLASHTHGSGRPTRRAVPGGRARARHGAGPTRGERPGRRRQVLAGARRARGEVREGCQDRRPLPPDVFWRATGSRTSSRSSLGRE